MPILVWFALSQLLLVAGFKWLPLERPAWRLILTVMNAAWFLLALTSQPWLALPAGLSLVSTLRITQGRYGLKRLRRVLARSASWLALATVVITVWLAVKEDNWQSGWQLLSALSLAAVASRALVLVLYRGLKHQFGGKTTVRANRLPPLTLAVPARNETHALADHLRSAAASRYDKLEIIVLDDCSQDSTPDIVRSFANDGIRFVQGTAPASGWLGKNYAYQTLLSEASGDWICFAGVDIRFEADSLARLVTAAEQTGADLVSVMPYRRNLDLLPVLARPLRYFWQLGIRGWPLMNSCWLVRRQWLLKTGSFAPHKHSVWPEQQLAAAARRFGTYRFVISTPELGITTRKRPSSLWETAKRTLYPLQKRELFWLAAKSLLLGSWLLLPLSGGLTYTTGLLLVFGWSLLWLAFLASELWLQPSGWWLTAWLLPLNVFNEVWLGLVSAYGYEFGRVNWKGRNICLPVLAQDSRVR
jgi:glycosyltransferase involved in cell wall biosynthesis